VLATDLATECEEQEDVTESPLERRNLFQATSENITLELSREDLLGAIPYTSLGNNTKQILLRIPSSSSAGSFARNMRRENFLDTLLENLSRDKDGGTEQATKWLMTTLAKKNERLFTEVVLVQCQIYRIRTAVLNPFFYVTWQDIIYLLRSLNDVISIFFSRCTCQPS
jgi:hypothetical protein